MKKYDIKAKTGEYTKDGQTKSKYSYIGAVIETKKGLMVKIDTLPVNWDGWAYLNDPADKPESNRGVAPEGVEDVEVDLSAIPF